MPVVKVSGLPTVLSTPQFAQVLKDYQRKIIMAVLSVNKLGLHETHEVTVFFPADFLIHDGSTLVIEITGCTEKPARTPEVLNKLAKSVGETVQSFYPDSFVECFIASFNPSQGFWCSKK